MNNQKSNSTHWYSHNWLNIFFCLVLLPLGLIAFWKNGYKTPVLVVSGIWILLFAYAWSSEPKLKNPTITGLTNLSFSNLLMEMEGNGYSVVTSMKSNMEWNATMNNGENTFDMMVYPMDGSEIERVEVIAKNNSGDITEIQNILQKIVSFSYETAEPQLAKAWLIENINNAKSEAAYGGVKFSLSNSLKSNIQLSIKAIK